MKNSKGFTLIELMVVVLILGILASVVVQNIMDEPDKARVIRAKQDIRSLVSALNIYKLDNFHYPSTQQGLQALVSAPAGKPAAANWKQGGYVERLVDDPWGNEYQYLSPGMHGRVDVYSFGADGESGGNAMDADIGSWEN